MKIAYCLYGQPRNLEMGHKTISKFVENCDIDFYYHTWTLCNGEKYIHSGHRNIRDNELMYDENIINKINLLYKPKAYVNELSRDFSDEMPELNKSLLYSNTPHPINKNNTLSHYYSKQKVRDLLMNESIKNKINYDLVVISRFDMLVEIDINLNNLDTRYIYWSDIHHPSPVTSDAMIISNYNIFLNSFNIYNNLYNMMNDENLNKLVNTYGIPMALNAENLLFTNYLYYYKDLSNVKYINIPNFC